jgi:hypothetical protein
MTPPSGTIQAVRHYSNFETDDASGVVVGVSGLKRLDRSVAMESGVDAYITLGPFNLESSTGQKAIIQEAVVDFGDNTTDHNGTVDFYAASSAEGVVSLPAGRKKSKTIESLQDNRGRCFPRIGGTAGLVKVTLDDNDDHISIEGIDLYLQRTGKER